MCKNPASQIGISRKSICDFKARGTRTVNSKKLKLQEDAGDGDHLQRGGGFADPARFHHHLADKIMQNDRAGNNDDIARDDEHRKPDGKFIRPVAEAERDDGREQQALVGDGIEDHAEPAALIVTARDVAVDAVAGRRGDKDEIAGMLPVRGCPLLDALP